MKKIFCALISIFLLMSIMMQSLVYAYSEPSIWASDEVEDAIWNELVPDSVKMDYHAYITREQFCEMVILAYEALSGNTAEIGYEEFVDTDNDEILKAANLGIVEGYGNGYFGPDDLITREQIAVMVVRMLDCSVSSVDIYDYSRNYYTDDHDISSWARPAIDFAYENNIIYGIGDLKIAPKRNTTCEEAVLLVNRTYAKYVSYDDYDDGYNIKYIDDDMYYTDPYDLYIDTEDGITYVDNEVIIHAKKGTSRSKIEDIISEYDGIIIGEIALTDTYQVQLYDSYNYDELTDIINELERNSCIESVSLNLITEDDVSYEPNDEEWADDWGDEQPSGLNWGVEAINAPEAWDYRAEMKNVNVGIIDNCFLEHDDLEYKETLFNNPDTVEKEKYHGTHVAGTVGATFDNNLGISGVCPKANLYAVSFSSKSDKNSTMSYYTALTYLISMKKCKAINISLGYEPALMYAVQYNPSYRSAHNISAAQLGQYLRVLLNLGNDFVICVSAGNCNNKIYEVDEDSEYGYKYVSNKGQNIGIEAANNSKFAGIEDKDIKDRIIVVGACGNSGNGRYRYSDFSNVGSRVDVVAPGEDIYSTVDENGYDEKNGTSMAAPHVTGLAAMLFAADGTLTGKEVKKIIVDTANINVSGTNRKMINAAAAVEKVLGVNTDVKDDSKKVEDDKKDNEKTDYSIKNTDYNSDVMGVEDFVAYDDECYYYKSVGGGLVKESKDGDDAKIIYNGKFRYICAIDSSYVYVLEKNGDVNKLIRVEKDGNGSETLLSNVYDVHWQDNRYIYLTFQDNNTAIEKLDRRDFSIETCQEFEYPVVKVIGYENEKSGKHYVITYKYDFLSSLLDKAINYYYVIDKDGNILKDCGEANLMEDYHIWKYPNYIRYEKIVVQGQGKSKQSEDVYWGEKGTTRTKRINSASGWRFFDCGIISMRKTGSSYSIVFNSAEDCSEKILFDDTEKTDYRLIDFDSDGTYYCVNNGNVVQRNLNSEFVKYLDEFKYDGTNVILQSVGDYVMVFSNDDATEAELIAKIPKSGKTLYLK